MWPKNLPGFFCDIQQILVPARSEVSSCLWRHHSEIVNYRRRLSLEFLTCNLEIFVGKHFIRSFIRRRVRGYAAMELMECALAKQDHGIDQGALQCALQKMVIDETATWRLEPNVKASHFQKC